MEMPINVIIILFIAVIVGGAVLYFTNNTLLKSQSELDKLRDDPQSKDMVVELASADAPTMLNLANECVRKGKRDGALDKDLCFAVFASTFTLPTNGQALDLGFTLDTTGVAAGATAVRVQYDPINNKVVLAS